MDSPIAVYKGETFQSILIYRDHVSLNGEIGNIDLPVSEIECLTCVMCQDRECRHWIDLPDLDNCLLNTDHEFTLDEIGQIDGISRQRVDQLVGGQNGTGNHRQTGALAKYTKQFKKMTGSKSISDMLPDPTTPVLSRVRTSQKQRGGMR